MYEKKEVKQQLILNLGSMCKATAITDVADARDALRNPHQMLPTEIRQFCKEVSIQHFASSFVQVSSLGDGGPLVLDTTSVIKEVIQNKEKFKSLLDQVPIS
eukprot:TRINITY_DN116057_c0_g1_i1.p2 TRINITY_DN116057_c0_g1~~TRINITY_DN116057_c0_g1_i1.p2  ORF type:complete len:102 (+),score=9.08 TRINITY_DN116057_c0_g1_i1:496-801(+)